MEPQVTQTNPWLPTRKWGVNVVTGLGALATMYFTSGTWDVEESISAVGLAVAAISTYLIPNDPSNTNSP